VIYGIADDPSLPPAPREVTLGLETLRNLLKEGALTPPAEPVKLRPHLQYWPSRSGEGGVATGACESPELIPGRLLFVEGWFQAVKAAPDSTALWAGVRAWVESEVAALIREAFPGVRVDVTGGHSARE